VTAFRHALRVVSLPLAYIAVPTPASQPKGRGPLHISKKVPFYNFTTRQGAEAIYGCRQQIRSTESPAKVTDWVANGSTKAMKRLRTQSRGGLQGQVALAAVQSDNAVEGRTV